MSGAAIVWGVKSTDWGWYEDNMQWDTTYLWPTRSGEFLIGAAVVDAPYGAVRLPDGGYLSTVDGADETKVRELIEDAKLTVTPELFLVGVN